MTNKFWWAQRDTRWDVYPQKQPVELIMHNWQGFHMPLPDGRWYKTSGSFVLLEETVGLQGGFWREEKVTETCKILHYERLAVGGAALDPAKDQL